MAAIRGRDTQPELLVRTTLHVLGYRFRLHDKALSGRPDLVFPSRRKVLFVHGCFWHGHTCRFGLAQPKSNVPYWKEKLASNRRRDARVSRRLRRAGWSVGIVWECQVKSGAWLPKTVAFLERGVAAAEPGK